MAGLKDLFKFIDDKDGEEKNLPAKEPKPASGTTLRVILTSEQGDMCTTILPRTMEGRYKFLDASGKDKYPFYIEAEQGRWVMNIGRESDFIQSPSQDPIHGVKRRITLRNMMIANLRYKNETFVVYVEQINPGDNTFLPYYIEEKSDYTYTIGRLENNHICYPSDPVSRVHASLHWNGTTWEIRDKSTNGTYVNNRRISFTTLAVGDTIFIMGLYIIIGTGYILINNGSGRVTINTPKIWHITEASELTFAKPAASVPPDKLFDRQPRRIVKIAPDPIEIEMPPTPLSGGKIPLMLRLGSPLLMGGRALVTGNYFMAMTSMVLPALTQGMTEKDRKEYEAKRLERYREYLVFKTEEIHKEKLLEEQRLNYNYPDLATAMQFAISKKRLWERRKSDEDFLNIRIGCGEIPMIAQKQYSKKGFEMEPDVLTEEMYEVAEKEVLLERAPVMLSLTEDFVTGVSGSRVQINEFFRNMIMQIAVTHSYDEVKLVVLADADDTEAFGFVKYLPHNWSNDRDIRFFAVSQPEAQQIATYLIKETEEALSQNKKYDVRGGVSYVVLAMSKNLFNCVEMLQMVLDRPEYCGVSVVACFEGLPKECSKIIDLSNQLKIVDYIHPEEKEQHFTLDPYDGDVAQKAIRQLMTTKLMMDSAIYSLPNMITFLEMYNVGRVEHLNPLKRWEDNNPVKSLAAPVGVGTDGQLFMLDLHEKHQGPHGLVAGMTGSGKSEFIITYILSMAVNYSPDEAAFVLIDYKGGGLADAFENKTRGIHLPHLVGTITNLDGAAIQRSLMSINSELKRRQEVFKRTKAEVNEGTMDIYDYQKLYRSKRVSEPMPHLFIISDEFAELKAQQPEFMDELISTARIGRSLGVHLILATQKPGGVVNDQIRSNTKFRVCLRVQDRGDSMEMLKRPDAAELKHTGRYYLQVGYNEFFAQGQSAWCGAEYMPQDEVAEEVDETVQFIDNVGQTIYNAKPPVKREASGVKQIVAVVQYLSDLAKAHSLEQRMLWLPPLADKIDIDSLNEESETNARRIVYNCAMLDDPTMQKQYPLRLDLTACDNILLMGEHGSGKTSFIQSMLYTISNLYTPEQVNYYILDYSSRLLKLFAKLPHCGEVLTEEEDSLLDSFFEIINGLIQQRKKLFTQIEADNFETACHIQSMPLILVIIDNLAGMGATKRGQKHLGNRRFCQ